MPTAPFPAEFQTLSSNLLLVQSYYTLLAQELEAIKADMRTLSRLAGRYGFATARPLRAMQEQIYLREQAMRELEAHVRLYSLVSGSTQVLLDGLAKKGVDIQLEYDPCFQASSRILGSRERRR